jgi:hypothetical protein
MTKLSASILLAAAFACAASLASAENAVTAQEPVKKAVKKTRTAAKKDAETGKDQQDVKGLLPVAYDCELGNKLTIYNDANDDQQITLQWNKHLHRMTRVSTTTGAHRFENAANGLVWIGIPAKGMLLDSKKGKQLANECRNADQKLLTQQVAENS